MKILRFLKLNKYNWSIAILITSIYIYDKWQAFASLEKGLFGRLPNPDGIVATCMSLDSSCGMPNDSDLMEFIQFTNLTELIILLLGSYIILSIISNRKINKTTHNSV